MPWKQWSEPIPSSLPFSRWPPSVKTSHSKCVSSRSNHAPPTLKFEIRIAKKLSRCENGDSPIHNSRFALRNLILFTRCPGWTCIFSILRQLTRLGAVVQHRPDLELSGSVRCKPNMSAIWGPTWIFIATFILGQPFYHIGLHIYHIYVKVYSWSGYICKLGSIRRPGGGFIIFADKGESLLIGSIIVHDVDHGISATIRSKSDLPRLWIPGWRSINPAIKGNLL